MGEANFSQTLVATEYWEALEKSEVLALNGICYCENTFVIFRK